MMYLDAFHNGVKGDGITDDTAALNAFCTKAQQEGLIAYLPPGVFKTTGPIYANGNDFRMQGCGHLTQIKPASSGYDGIIFGETDNDPYNGSGSKPSGWVRDISVIGPTPKPRNGTAGIKLNGIRQFKVENTYVSNFDIGYDLINNCFGSSFHNIRALSAGLNVGVLLRTGSQSGNDIQFYNPWIGGEAAAVWVGINCGGFQFFGGQFSNTVQTAATSDIPQSDRGVVVLGKDYLTGALGPVMNFTIDGIDIEDIFNSWVLRTFAEVEVTLRGLGVNANDTAYPALGLLKMSDAAASNVQMQRVPIRGTYSNAADSHKLLVVSGAQSSFSITETACRYAGSIGGVTQNGGSLLVQSQLPSGSAMFRDGGKAKLLLDKILLRPNSTTGELEISSDWGTTWKTVAFKP